MISEINTFIHNINIGYATLSILFLIVSLLFLYRKGVSKIFVEFILILYVCLGWTLFYFTNDILNEIFSLRYLSVKLYLVLLIVGNIIMIANINFKFHKANKILNYLLFATNLVILLINVLVVISNKYDILNFISVTKAMEIMDINFIIFIVYLNCMCLVYIIRYIVSLIKGYIAKRNDLRNQNDAKDEEDTAQVVDSGQYAYQYKSPAKEAEVGSDKPQGFFINGVDCSAIFDGSSKEEIIQNYYILLNDINARLTNGYTIFEYTKIREIMNRLHVNDINNMNIDVNTLNHISDYEYNLLKSYISTRRGTF